MAAFSSIAPGFSHTAAPGNIYSSCTCHFALATSVGVRPPGQNEPESQIATSSPLGARNWIPITDIEVYPEHIIRVSHCLQAFSPSHMPPRPAFSPPTAPTGAADTCSFSGRRVGMVGRAGRGRGEPGPASTSGAATPTSGTARRGLGRGGRPSVHPRGGFWAGSRLPV